MVPISASDSSPEEASSAHTRAAPAVSVVVSTYNRADQLPAALHRLATQRTSLPYEVILVDNNSTDDTGAVIRNATRQYPRLVRGEFEPSQGVSHGRNAGIRLSRAPIVAFTDDDVIVEPDWLEGIARAMEEHPEVGCVGGRVLPIWRTPPPRWLTREHWSPLALVDYGDEPFYVDHRRPVCLVTANVAYRRSALDRIGWFSPEFPRCQDHELLLRLWRAGQRGLYLPSLVARCEVPERRLTWAYHRQWHATHGHFLAQMEDHERSARAHDHAEPVTLFGSPAAAYRELASSVGRYLVLRVTGRAAAARQAEGRARYRASFIAARARLWRREQRGAVREVVRFMAAWAHQQRLRVNR
jgi:GT2 family glycosyltransferase